MARQEALVVLVDRQDVLELGDGPVAADPRQLVQMHGVFGPQALEVIPVQTVLKQAAVDEIQRLYGHGPGVCKGRRRVAAEKGVCQSLG